MNGQWILSLKGPPKLCSRRLCLNFVAFLRNKIRIYISRESSSGLTIFVPAIQIVVIRMICCLASYYVLSTNTWPSQNLVMIILRGEVLLCLQVLLFAKICPALQIYLLCYCKMLIFREYFYLALLAVTTKSPNYETVKYSFEFT